MDRHCGECRWLRPLWWRTKEYEDFPPYDAWNYSESPIDAEFRLDIGVCKAPYAIPFEWVRNNLERRDFFFSKNYVANKCKSFSRTDEEQ